MMDDLISRRDAINTVSEITTTMSVCTSKDECYGMKRMQKQAITELENMPSAEQEAPDINVGNMDAISRQQAIDKFIDDLEEIFSDIRERHGDDSVCGLCEYDGAYIGQSGDWCNECPGFDRDDCFKLSDKTRKKWTDEIIKALPSAQPEIIRCKDCVYQVESWSGIKYCEAHGDHIGKDYDYCSNARRKENGQADFTASCD